MVTSFLWPGKKKLAFVKKEMLVLTVNAVIYVVYHLSRESSSFIKGKDLCVE